MKKIKEDVSKAEEFGIAQADVVMKAAHLTYNATRGRKIVETCIKVLQERINEIQPKKADPKYKKARYGEDKKVRKILKTKKLPMAE